MANNQMQSEEAIRQLLSRTRLDSPSADFTSRLMSQIEMEPEPSRSWVTKNQWILLFISVIISVLLVIYPVWTWFGYEFTPLQFISFYSAEIFRSISVWLGEALSRLGGMGKMMYLIPVSVAILILVSIDQSIRKPSLKTSKA